MSSTHKKVVIRKIDRDAVNGYVGANFVVDGKIEILNTSGVAIKIDLAEIKGVYFVREFGDSEILPRKTFATRPRTEGLWVRLRFRDNEVMEGLMPNNLIQLGPEGFLLTPPDTRSNTQRIFVPRTALSELTVIAVVGSASHRRKTGPSDARQVTLFDE